MFIYGFIFSCLSLSWFSVILEIQSLITVLQHVFRNPFILVMSALGCHCCYGSVQDPNINLKPWISIGCFSWPGSPFVSVSRIVKSASVCSVIRTPDSWFQPLVGFRFRWALIPKPRIPLAKHIPESGIQISLHEALKYDFSGRNNLLANGVGLLKIEGKADRTAKGW